MRYELLPTNGRKSFYGKAIVTDEGGIKTLTSYTTDVARIDADGNFYRLWEGCTKTTLIHVNEFRKQYGLRHITNSEWFAMDVQ